MKVVVLYRSHSEHGRAVEEYLHEYYKRTGRKLASIDIDTREGARTAELYDIVEYPAVIALASDGTLQRSWMGPLPLMNEITGYALEQ